MFSVATRKATASCWVSNHTHSQLQAPPFLPVCKAEGSFILRSRRLGREKNTFCLKYIMYLCACARMCDWSNDVFRLCMENYELSLNQNRETHLSHFAFYFLWASFYNLLLIPFCRFERRLFSAARFSSADSAIQKSLAAQIPEPSFASAKVSL